MISVYLLKVVANPNLNKRYNAPHLDSMGYAQRIAQSHNYTRNRCCPFPLDSKKIATFSTRSAKTLSMSAFTA